MPIAADQFPRPLLSLDDSQLAALMAASRPLQPADNPPFSSMSPPICRPTSAPDRCTGCFAKLNRRSSRPRHSTAP